MSALPHDLVTGIAKIDQEHEQLFALGVQIGEVCCSPKEFIVDCDNCCSSNDCEQAVLPLIDSLIELTMSHFMNEERLMGGLHGQASAAHKFDHAEVSSNLANLAGQIVKNQIKVSPRRIQQTVADYLERHVIDFDMPLAAHLKAFNRPPKSVLLPEMEISGS